MIRTVYIRWVINTVLLIGLIFLVFFLSGTASPTPGIRSIYLQKLKYVAEETPSTLESAKGPTSTLFNTFAASVTGSINPSGKPKTDKITPSTSSTQTTTSTDSFQTDVGNSDETIGKRDQIESGVREVRPNVKQAHARVWEEAPGNARARVWEEFPVHVYARPRIHSRHLENKFLIPGETLARRDQEIVTDGTAGGDKIKQVRLAVLVGYFGTCVSRDGAPFKCTKVRHSTENSLRKSLFPPVPGSNQNTSLLISSDPENLIGVALAAQKSLSPVPLILAIVILGTSLVISTSIAIKETLTVTVKHETYSTGPSRVLLPLTSVGFAVTLMAVALFQSCATTVERILETSDPSKGLQISAKAGGYAITLGWAGVIFSGLAMLALHNLQAINGLLSPHSHNQNPMLPTHAEGTRPGVGGGNRPLELVNKLIGKKNATVDNNNTDIRLENINRSQAGQITRPIFNEVRYGSSDSLEVISSLAKDVYPQPRRFRSGSTAQGSNSTRKPENTPYMYGSGWI